VVQLQTGRIHMIDPLEIIDYTEIKNRSANLQTSARRSIEMLQGMYAHLNRLERLAEATNSTHTLNRATTRPTTIANNNRPSNVREQNVDRPV